MLKHPDFKELFYMNCDASEISLGVVLYQIKDGHEGVIGFASRILSKCERNYTITEREFFSIVFGLNKFRTYILGHKLIIRTDHKAISFFKRCKLSHGRLTRWILALQEYDIDFEYIPGKKNIIADILSRVNTENNEVIIKAESIYRIYNVMCSKDELKNILNNIHEQQNNDKNLNKIINKIKQKDEEVLNYYKLLNNILFINQSFKQEIWKLYIPDSLINKLIMFYHENYGHMGRTKTKQCISENNYFKNMDKHISRIIRSCNICQKAKVPNCNYNSETFSIISKHKLDQVFIDISGPFPPSRERYPKKFILIMIDNFTKYVKLYSLYKANTKTILKIILNDYVKILTHIRSWNTI